MTSTANAVTPVEELIAAAQELSVTGRWKRASRLLDTCSTDDPEPRARIARAAAQVALEQDWFAGTDTAAARIEAAEKEFPGGDWDLDFARLRNTYRRLLVVDGGLRLGPDGKDPEALVSLRREAESLRDSAPDEGRRGWAEMYLGLITDNHFADLAGAPPHYASALSAAESVDDPLLAREALRHLGDHDHDAGDHARTLDRWRRATTLGAAAGTVPGTLSQQLLLAVLARDSGDEAGARALAAEVARWAEAIGAVRLAAQARGFLAGVDPTAPPAESGS
ncbi:hypothetical protein [Streptomyces prunicolor]|uniref:Tetratricopeptide repeat protein n=1 Tax=Streptomyces prunicolor TaxID=67348 RepID=A0ABU4FKR0_9ACTN|nr:hypothetical protein [Streptomyces prunicolor]MDV7221172.1 hypothetical protein [Streptomyces prunicolor]